MSSHSDLRHTLERIAKLEDEHGFLGVSFCVVDSDAAISAEQVVDYVLDITKSTVEIVDAFGEIPQPFSPGMDRTQA